MEITLSLSDTLMINVDPELFRWLRSDTRFSCERASCRGLLRPRRVARSDSIEELPPTLPHTGPNSTNSGGAR